MRRIYVVQHLLLGFSLVHLVWMEWEGSLVRRHHHHHGEVVVDIESGGVS